ncbi:hypothetical protein AAFF_G00117860 [Aldrovandia affinis]|uniref:KY-like immunoglobulin-like domain-containing protein n=1 Tax=Aldrovandia affinis TaxID=143900 RepID=A0AAD7WB76_9TELE|nr:hypothetical protein AAFF_G00117860 [Aldrovandia affinis]
MTLRPDGMKLDVYPESTGRHKLKIYAKASDTGEEETYSEVCEYQIHCKAVSREMKVPKDLINPVGPSWLSERKGLREASQLDPIVHTADGRCSFRFRVVGHLDLMAMQGDWVEFRVQVPRSGLYLFSVYAKDKSKTGNYSFVCNYLISCTNPRAGWPLYPLKYTSWKEDYDLVEPLAGVLPANRAVSFKMRIPDVSQVSVGGRDTQDLSLDADGYWSGCCSTAECKDLNVMVQVDPGDRSRSFILSYIVESCN